MRGSFLHVVSMCVRLAASERYLSEEVRSFDIDGKESIKAFLGGFGDVLQAQFRSICDERIYSAEHRHDGIDHVFDLIDTTGVCHDARGIFAPKVLDDLLSCLYVVRIVDDNEEAFVD